MLSYVFIEKLFIGAISLCSALLVHGIRMQFPSNPIDFILHVDKYIGEFIREFGIATYGILFLIIFLETGLVVTPFLPGDSLLFVSGAFAAQGALNVVVLFFLLSIAAILGDSANYWIGHYLGEKFFVRRRLIKAEHLEKTKKFYEKHGGKTIIYARFVPIVRTFAPFVAGIGTMEYGRFLIFNILGGVLWVGLFVFGGYFFGNVPIIKENLTIVIIAIIFVSILPPIIEYVKSKLRARKNAAH